MWESCADVSQFKRALYSDIDSLKDKPLDDALHQHLCGILGVKPTGAKVVQLTDHLSRENVPIGEWWLTMRTAKSREQWRALMMSKLELPQNLASLIETWDDILLVLINFLVRSGRLRRGNLPIFVRRGPDDLVPEWPAA